MKKIGILVNSIGYGGNERSAVNIAKAISAQYDISIIIQEDCGNHYGYTGHVFNLNTPCANSILGKVLNSIRRIIRLKRFIRKNQIETLFIILPVTNPINYLRFPCKKIVTCRHCGDLMANTDKYIHMTERSELIVCNSQQQTDFIVQKAPHLKNKARTIYNILDVNQIQHLCANDLEASIESFMKDHKCIISTGRLVDQKGWNNLLKSFSVLVQEDEDIRLILFGEGVKFDKINKLIEDLQLTGKVLLPGFQENPFRYIARSDVYALSSFYEGFPNTLIEAMACGTPVVSTNCPSGPSEILCVNSSEQISVGRGGILVHPFDEKTSNWDATDIREEHILFAKALKRVLTDINLQQQLAYSAIERSRDFSGEKISGAWVQVL